MTTAQASELIYQKIYQVVKNIPEGKVLTYGRIAQFLHIKSPRLVGRALHFNPDPKNIPCHRVVNRKGSVAASFAFGGGEGQKAKLISEGVEFRGDQVDLNSCLWEIQ